MLVYVGGAVVSSSMTEDLGIMKPWNAVSPGLWWWPWQGEAEEGQRWDAGVLFCLVQLSLRCQPLLRPQRKYSGSAAINLIGHWMSMLPHPITSGKVLDLQKGGEKAAVRIAEVRCCFLLQSWPLGTVGPCTKAPRRKQSSLLFCSARAGFDPVCVKSKPRFGIKSLSRMKSRI